MVVEGLVVAMTPITAGLQPAIIKGKDKEGKKPTTTKDNKRFQDHADYFEDTASIMSSTAKEFEAFGTKMDLLDTKFQESITSINEKHELAHQA